MSSGVVRTHDHPGVDLGRAFGAKRALAAGYVETKREARAQRRATDDEAATGR